MNVARQAAIKAGVPVTVPAETDQSRVRVRPAGSRARHRGDAGGYAQVVVAGGTESMSQAPYLLPQARWGLRMGHGQVYDTMLGEGLTCAIEGCHMGMTAEEVSRRFGIARADQDAFAAESQARAAARRWRRAPSATRSSPCRCRRRRAARRRSTPTSIRARARRRTKLSGLKPAFTPERHGDGRQRLGHQRRRRGARRGVAGRGCRRGGSRPIARVLSYAVVGVEPMVMGLGPIGAVRLALDRASPAPARHRSVRAQRGVCRPGAGGRRASSASTAPRSTCAAGAIALGHPIGASGARVLTTLIYALRARGGGRGVASLCASAAEWESQAGRSRSKGERSGSRLSRALRA